MKNLLIIGGTGFIGSKLAEKAAKKYSVTSLSKSKPDRFIQIPSVKYLSSDITTLTEMKELVKGNFTHVVNLAGYVDHSSFSGTGKDIIRSHFVGLLNILENLNLNDLESFVNVGSSDEYWGRKSPMKEDELGESFSCYSFAKTAAAQLVDYLSSFENFPGKNVKLFLVYGPGQSKERFLPSIVSSCLKGEEFNVSPGNQIRDFCYIDDVVYGLMRILESNDCIGETLNLASGCPIEIKTVVEMIVSHCRAGQPNFGGIPYRSDEQMSLYADISKMESLLNWTPRTKFEHGLTQTINFYK